jgi:aminotransferase
VFAEYMAREVGVAVVPGSSFYAGQPGSERAGAGTGRVRLNFAKREATLREAARRLQRLSD